MGVAGREVQEHPSRFGPEWVWSQKDTPNPSISAETLERFPKYHRMDALLRYRRNIDPPGGTPLTTRLIAPGYLDFLHSTRNNNDNNADSDGLLDNDAHEGRRGLDSGSDEETPQATGSNDVRTSINTQRSAAISSTA